MQDKDAHDQNEDQGVKFQNDSISSRTKNPGP